MNLSGTMTALVTPFFHGEIDKEGLKKNIQYQITNGISGLLLLGTTGEAPTLLAEEQRDIIAIAVEETRGKAALFVGTGGNSTQATLEKTLLAQNLGADGAVVVTPYYNKPTQEGIWRHFEAIASRVELPIIVYNIPGRCSVNIEVATMKRLASLPNIIGVKECSGHLDQAMALVSMAKEHFPHFSLWAGDDALALPLLSIGACGLISVASNVVPRAVVSMVDAALNGDFALARKKHYELLPLFKALFLETNPIPIKAAMAYLGLCGDECRLPLCAMSDEPLNQLKRVLGSAEICSKLQACHGEPAGAV